MCIHFDTHMFHCLQVPNGFVCRIVCTVFRHCDTLRSQRMWTNTQHTHFVDHWGGTQRCKENTLAVIQTHRTNTECSFHQFGNTQHNFDCVSRNHFHMFDIVRKLSIVCIRSFHISNKYHFHPKSNLHLNHSHCNERDFHSPCSQRWHCDNWHIDSFGWWYPQSIDLSHCKECMFIYLSIEDNYSFLKNIKHTDSLLLCICFDIHMLRRQQVPNVFVCRIVCINSHIFSIWDIQQILLHISHRDCLVHWCGILKNSLCMHFQNHIANNWALLVHIIYKDCHEHIAHWDIHKIHPLIAKD